MAGWQSTTDTNVSPENGWIYYLKYIYDIYVLSSLFFLYFFFVCLYFGHLDAEDQVSNTLLTLSAYANNKLFTPSICYPPYNYESKIPSLYFICCTLFNFSMKTAVGKLSWWELGDSTTTVKRDKTLNTYFCISFFSFTTFCWTYGHSFSFMWMWRCIQSFYTCVYSSRVANTWKYTSEEWWIPSEEAAHVKQIREFI